MIERLQAFSDWFTAEDWPDATCPSCGVGSLRADSIQQYESTASLDVHADDAWEPWWVHGFFTCTLRCQRAKCREIVVAMGAWHVREIPNGAPWEVASYYKLHSALPPLQIMTTFNVCPDSVQEALTKASEVIWIDPSAAGTRLRFAVELALDAQKVPRWSSGPKRARLSTHHRIDRLRKTRPEAAELLEATKWIGNQGSHEDSLTIPDVLEAAQILDLAFAQLFDKKANILKRRAQKIVRAKRVPKSV